MPWIDKFLKRKGTEERGAEEFAEGNTESAPENKENLTAAAVSESGESPAENTADHRREFLLMCGKCLVVAATLGFLAWYLRMSSYYKIPEEHKTLFTNSRTYFMLFMCAVIFTLVVTPNRLSERINRLLGWIWFLVSPFVIYFTLFHMNSARFSIVFADLEKIAVYFTFIFLYLVLFLLLLILGSVRWPVAIVSVAVMILAVANWFVVDFRGQAISAADLFSIQEAATVAGGFEYDIDWYVFSEVFLVFAACVVSFKIRKFQALKPAPRLAILGVWLIITGGYYHICCRTSFLEDHDIRSQGFTHQLRYKQFDMLFTTLCTCFYLAADKPDGYSLEKVQEIAAAYVEQDEEESGGGLDPVKEADASGTTTVVSGGGTDVSRTTDSGRENGGAGTAAVDGNSAGTASSAEGNDGAGTTSSGGTGTAFAGGNSTLSEWSSARVSIAEGMTGKVTAAETDSHQEGTDKVMAQNSGFNTPNLIVIMNESFADYTSIGKGLVLSQDCMPFIHGLEENTIKGTAYVSVFGGNTPNSEYEFLTGNTMGFLPPSSVGFNLFVRGEMPSLVSELEAVGYDTLAIHPYRGTNYRRHLVYPQLGFDEYLTRDDFENPEYIRSYISDWELSEKIIRKYLEHDETTDAPFFSYNVTMQNHGGYVSTNTKGVPQRIRVRNSTVNRIRTSIYVNLIRESDSVYQKLVEYFKDVDEPVAILMFGDHQANLGDNTYNYLLGKAEESLTPEERMEKYKVPFVCWANYDIEEEVIEKTSLNYLYSIIADRLGLPLTGYQKYLLDLNKEIPVLAAGGYWTADGDFYELHDETSPYFDRINEYNILEYNYIFGKDDRDLDLFSLSS